MLTPPEDGKADCVGAYRNDFKMESSAGPGVARGGPRSGFPIRCSALGSGPAGPPPDGTLARRPAHEPDRLHLAAAGLPLAAKPNGPRANLTDRPYGLV